MTDVERNHSVITGEEIAMLNGVGKSMRPSGVDQGFRTRHIVMSLILLFFLARLLFYPDTLQAELSLPAYMGDMSSYFQMRGAFASVLAIIYFFSYVKDWYFPRVSLIIAALAFAGLASDFFNIYRFINGALSTVPVLLVVARCIVVYCLFMNSIRDNRAPLMPRHFFS
jgi:hypothetical protein